MQATLRPGPDGRGLCVAFDFGRVTGYVALRRTLDVEVPPRYEIDVSVRGDAPPIEWQLKMVDDGGLNVWWARRAEFQLPLAWQTVHTRQRQIEFAWGPSADRHLTHASGVELVIASGRAATRGSACFDRLVLRRLPDLADAATAPLPVGRDAPGTFDLGGSRDFDVLGVHWRGGVAAPDYAIEFSDDGQRWQLARAISRARGPSQSHWMADSRARFVRIAVDGHRQPEPVVERVTLSDTSDVNAYFMQLAGSAVRGRYPRAYAGEQSYWTVLGVDGGQTASLLSEDGVLEPAPAVGGIEPFLIDGNRVLSWADARMSHDLVDGELPMPRVHWRTGALALDIEAFGAGTPERDQALVRYTVRNLSHRARDVRLALAWRPFQANPPTQFLAHPGGASRTADLAWDGRALRLDGTTVLQAIDVPSAVRIEPLAAGPVGDWLTGVTEFTRDTRQVDPAGYASAVLVYRLHLAPGEQRSIAAAAPLHGQPHAPTHAELMRWRAVTVAHWRERLNRVRISGPAALADVLHTLRSAVGQVLVNRSGAALQPGARAYARSWIRDGALSSSALLRLGQDDAVRDFLRWYAPFQFASGKVPCCATVRGADPVPENDSDGEFAYAVNELWRYTRDLPTARALWPNVRAAVDHMESLRQSERGENNRLPSRQVYYGLMPASISHEGYSDSPAYSYWDDFWAAIGYRSATSLAQALGQADDAQRIARWRDEFDADLLASLAASTRAHHLDLLPGSADSGDVDPTSSTVALSPGGGLGALPDDLVRATFERYWREFVARRDGTRPWDDYTPYEWRVVGSMVRLGQRERALAVMDSLYRDRRPLGWNQWAEVVGRDPRQPRFLGDMPHGWVASDQIRSVLDLFAYEQERTQALVLAAGIPWAWLSGPGLRVQGLRTAFGALSWRAQMHAAAGVRTIEFALDALDRVPAGGITLAGPWSSTARVWVDGRRWAGDARGIALQAPCRVRIEQAAPVPSINIEPATP